MEKEIHQALTQPVGHSLKMILQDHGLIETNGKPSATLFRELTTTQNHTPSNN